MNNIKLKETKSLFGRFLKYMQKWCKFSIFFIITLCGDLFWYFWLQIRIQRVLCSLFDMSHCIFFSRGHATLHFAVSVGPSVRRSVGPPVIFLNSERFSHYCSCPTVRDWIAVYPALFRYVRPSILKHIFCLWLATFVRCATRKCSALLSVDHILSQRGFVCFHLNTSWESTKII